MMKPMKYFARYKNQRCAFMHSLMIFLVLFVWLVGWLVGCFFLFVDLFIHLFIYLVVYLFIYSFIYSCIHSYTYEDLITYNLEREKKSVQVVTGRFSGSGKGVWMDNEE